MSVPVEVVAAVISAGDDVGLSSQPLKADQHVLLSQRLPNKHLAGFWEFPGGRVECGEDPEQALCRELVEELGIEPQVARPLCILTHHYPEKSVRLRFYRVSKWSGEPQGREGQAIEWVPWHQLPSRQMPAADQAILKLFGVSPHYIQVMEHNAQSASLNAWASQATSSHLLSWSESLLTQDALLADRVMGLWKKLRSQGHYCIVEGDPELAVQLGADGVELSQEKLMQVSTRPTGLDWVGAFCQDLLGVSQAAHLGLDFVVIEPSLLGSSVVSDSWLVEAIRLSGLPVFVRANTSMVQLPQYQSLGALGMVGCSEWDLT